MEAKKLYLAGAIAAVLVLALVPFQIAIFILYPLPATVSAWFALFDRNAWIGLFDLDLLMIVDTCLIGIMIVAVFVAMRPKGGLLLPIALGLELVSITTYFSSNPAFEMLALSRKHAAAATDTERNIALAAGEAMIATWEGTAFNVSYVLMAFAILALSVVMLRTGVFSRLTGWVGVVFGVTSIVPASAGTPGLVMSFLSLVPMWLWLALIAHRLFTLARTESRSAALKPSFA